MYPTGSNQKNALYGFYTLYLFQKMYFNSKMSKIGKEGSCVSGKLNDVQCKKVPEGRDCVCVTRFSIASTEYLLAVGGMGRGMGGQVGG